MNDSDIEGLAFAEKKAEEARQGIVSYSKQVIALVGPVLAKEVRELGDSVQHAIDIIKPADRVFTLQQIIAMRKVLDESRAEMIVAVAGIEQHLAVFATYIETYIAHGVPPQELDLGGGDIGRWFIPLRDVYDRLIHRMAPIHPHAYGVLAGVNLDIGRRIQNAYRAEKRIQESLDRAIACGAALYEQQTFLMSADGLEAREKILKDLNTFLHSLRIFMEKP